MRLLAVQSLPDASGLVDQLRELPIGVHGIAIGVLVVGVVLWFHGRKLVKPVTIGLFALTGAWVGFFGLSSTGLTEVVHPYAGSAVAAAVGAALGFALYRFSVALGFGVVLGIATPLVASAVLGPVDQNGQHGPLTPQEQMLDGVPVEDGDTPEGLGLLPDGEDAADRIREKLREGIDGVLGLPDSPDAPADESQDDESADQDGGSPADESEDADQQGLDDATKEALETATEKARAFLSALWDELELAWSQLPLQRQWTLAGSAALGLAGGVVLGLWLPKRAAGAVTAMIGAAIWLPAFVWLTQAYDLGPLTELTQGRAALEWLIVWGFASIAGMGIQWMGISQKKQNARSKDS